MGKKDDAEMAVNSLPDELKRAAVGLGFKKQCALKKLRKTRERDAFWVKVSWIFSAGAVGVGALGFPIAGSQSQAVILFSFMVFWALCGVGFALLNNRRCRQANEIEDYILKNVK